MKFVIAGCGLIGKKRAATLPAGSLAAACDLDLAKARSVVEGAVVERAVVEGAVVEGALVKAAVAAVTLEEALAAVSCDAVIVAVRNHALAPLAKIAILAGKHVLVEKPAAISTAEILELQSLARERNVRVRVGYNHRYHPAFQQARALVDSGALGPLMYVRGRYGHGGRLGYDREWRANPALSGGGELIDQGVHLIDLAAWFLGPFASIAGHVETYFWDMPVDDNAFLDLKTADGQTAWLHVSCSEWKNLFSFEIYGRHGKLHVEGLGGSYGVERLAYYKMLPRMGPPETLIYEYPGADTSFAAEMSEFLMDIETGREPSPGLEEAREALRVVEALQNP